MKIYCLFINWLIDRLKNWLIDWLIDLTLNFLMSPTVALSGADVKSNSECSELRKGNRTIILKCEGILLIY